MADVKISGLPVATTPLAGTEVLPIVQSSATKKVSIADVTAGRNISATGLKTGSGSVSNWANNASPVEVGQYAFSLAEQTSGSGLQTWNLYQDGTAAFKYKTNNVGLLLQYNATGSFNFYTAPAGVAGATASLTQVAALTDNMTISTGNLVINTAAKGIDFSANTHAAGMTSELLDWYEEGTWTPTDQSGAGLTFTGASGEYTRIGNLVKASFSLTYPSTASGVQNYISLPFVSNSGGGMYVTYTNYGSAICGYVDGTNDRFVIADFAGTSLTNANLSTKRIDGVVIYRAD